MLSEAMALGRRICFAVTIYSRFAKCCLLAVHFRPNPMSLLWLKVAVLLYGVASLAVLPAALYERPKWRLVALPATVAAVLFHFVSLAEMLNAAHHSLPVETHEVQSVLALLLAAGFVAVYVRYRTVALGIFVLPIAFLLSVLAAFRPGQEQLLPLRTGWIFLHIAMLLAAYAALFVSLLASLLYLIQERRLKMKQPSLAWLPPLETTDQIALKSLLFGLPCMTGGPADRIAGGAADDWGKLLSRSKDSARVRDVGGLLRHDLYPSTLGIAWAASGLSFKLRVPGGADRMGGEPVFQCAQVCRAMKTAKPERVVVDAPETSSGANTGAAWDQITRRRRLRCVNACPCRWDGWQMRRVRCCISRGFVRV